MANMYLGRKARVKARAARSASGRVAQPGTGTHHDEEMLVSAAQDAGAAPEVTALCVTCGGGCVLA